jgi:tetratricopeptide (TPR) repeat protein
MGVAARILRRQGQARLAGRIITEALAHLDASGLEPADRAAGRIRLLRNRAEARLEENRVSAAIADLTEATRLISELLDDARPAARISLVWLRASIELKQQRTAEAVASLTEAAAAAQWHQVWHAWITLELARAQLETGHPVRAEELVQEALRSFVRMGHRYGKAKAHTVLADIGVSQKHPERAVAELERALETMRNCGDRWAEATATLYLTNLLPQVGRAGEVTPLLRAAAERFAGVGDHARAADIHGELRSRAWRDLRRTPNVRWAELFVRPRSRTDVRWSGLIAATVEAGDR